MERTRVAILCFSALPYTDNWGGTQRVHYMANQLSSSFDVTVIAPKNTEKAYRTDEVMNYDTKFFENKLGKRLLALRKENVIGNSVNKEYSTYLKTNVYRFAVKACKFVNTAIYNEPTYFMGIVASRWIANNEKAIIEFLKRESVKALIISIPPWNIISVAFLKKVKKLGCKLIVDYRDPWNCWNNHKGYSRWKEKRIVDLVDSVFVTNDNHALKIVKDFNLPNSKIHVIMNGFDEDTWNEVLVSAKLRAEDLLVISFIGSIQFSGKESFRNPLMFMKALESFEYKDNVKFRIVGNYNQVVLDFYKDKIPHFEMIPQVSQKESFEWMLRSDVLVNFHTTNDNSSEYLIAGKIFDYYRSGARILSINGSRSVERKFVENNELGYYTPNTVKAIRNTLGQIFSDWISFQKKFKRSNSVDNTFSRQFQNKKAEGIIKILLNISNE